MFRKSAITPSSFIVQASNKDHYTSHVMPIQVIYERLKILELFSKILICLEETDLFIHSFISCELFKHGIKLFRSILYKVAFALCVTIVYLLWVVASDSVI